MIDFPNTPIVGQNFLGPNGATWQWDGTKWTITSVAFSYLPISGGILTGTLILAGDPTVNLGAATKQYVDARAGGGGGSGNYLPLTGGTLTGPLFLAADPTAPLGAATKQYVDAHSGGGGSGGLPLSGGTLTGPLILAADPTVALGAATKQYVDKMVPLAGGAMTGLLILSGDPTVSLGASTRQYVDNKVALYVPLGGGTMTGPLVLNTDPITALGAATKQYADKMVPLVGGTMTGPLTLSADPTAALVAATKQYVDTKVSTAGYLLTSGGTLTGPLILAADPLVNLGAATKQYVDNKVGSGGGLPLTGGTLTGPLTINATPAQYAGQKSGTIRWDVLLGDGTTETGVNNIGSDLKIRSYTDAGAIWQTPFKIERSTGNITTTNLMINTSFPQLSLNKTGPKQAGSVIAALNGMNRWQIVLGDGADETGGNVGSDFYIIRSLDSGFTQLAMQILRSNGNVNFYSPVSIPVVGDIAAAINRIPLGGGSSQQPIYALGNTLLTSPFLAQALTGNVSPSSNDIWLMPFSNPFMKTFTIIRLVVTNSAAGSLFRIGVYNRTDDGQPTNCLIDSGDLSATTNGERTATINLTLGPGSYYFSFNCNNGTAFYQCFTATNAEARQGYQASGASTSQIGMIHVAPSTYGPFPNLSGATITALSSGFSWPLIGLMP